MVESRKKERRIFEGILKTFYYAITANKTGVLGEQYIAQRINYFQNQYSINLHCKWEWDMIYWFVHPNPPLQLNKKETKDGAKKTQFNYFLFLTGFFSTP